ncbi:MULTISPECIES: NYN domain-containing protein [Paraburkholderia]|uniref:NYN domain-containing protein n=2 Tax=Paraburkholderia madseniana TaxID=2599607 RepID=A0AAP5ELA5_9BURK|nr:MULTISPECIES: NYN domain-containing protein [Paraburkholderia]MCX4144601.1 NYN domain-containing protein [Paraburkholderia madseniana]MDN7147553.1 NYN domain-containing protein [Paraburkholderia sp. WS6]MDQ6406433.1 NYN domain-containing protein [Paraburkholderia madseniana]
MWLSSSNKDTLRASKDHHMNSVWIVDGTYLAAALSEGASIEMIANMERELVAAQSAPMKHSLYFDLSRDVDQDLAGPLFSCLRSNRLRTPFDVRLVPLPVAANEAACCDARRLLAVETAVEAIRFAAESDCDRLVLTAADAALEPAISAVRLRYSKELWLYIAHSERAAILESFADRVIWLDS